MPNSSFFKNKKSPPLLNRKVRLIFYKMLGVLLEFQKITNGNPNKSPQLELVS